MSKEEKKLTGTEEETPAVSAAATEQQEAAEKAAPAEKPEKAPSRFNKKKLKYGALATSVTVVFIAVVVLLNVLASAIVDRYPIKADLTPSKFYEISQQSVDYVKTMDKDVNIVVLAKESYFQTNNYLKIVPETLDKYRQNSDGHITVDYYDMTAHPEIVAKYKDKYAGELSEADIIVTNGDRVKVLAFADIIKTEQTMDYNTYQYVNKYTFIGEQSLTSAIMSVTDANPKRVAMITKVGTQTIFHQYNQYAVAALQNLLDKNGYEITEVDLLADAVDPKDYDLAVLPAPYNDLTDDMVKKLDTFLYNDGKLGKDLFYMADVYQNRTPNLNAFLEVWNLQVGDSIIREKDSAKAQYVTIVLGQQTGNVAASVATIADETYAAQLSSTKLPIVAPLVRPIKLLETLNSDIETKAVLTSSDSSYLYPLTMDDGEDKSNPTAIPDGTDATTTAATTTTFNEENAETGVQNFMAVSTRTLTDDRDVYESHVMAIGACAMIDYCVAQSTAYNNAEFLISSINTMQGKENGIVIAEKALEQTSISIKEGQLRGLQTTVIVIIPLLVAVIGIVVYLRRKNR